MLDGKMKIGKDGIILKQTKSLNDIDILFVKSMKSKPSGRKLSPYKHEVKHITLQGRSGDIWK